MFRTELKLKPWSQRLDYSSRIVTLGSCFANNIAQRLAHSKFQVEDSPTGILFNPASIARNIELMIGGRGIAQESLVRLGQRWVSYEAHSLLSGATAESAMDAINSALRIGSEAIVECDILIITLGTAWVYRLRSTDEVVANCHKLPANRFTRRCLTVDEIVEMWQPIVASMPDKQWIFTVSPIRHVKDGLHANQVSKAILLQGGFTGLYVSGNSKQKYLQLVSEF